MSAEYTAHVSAEGDSRREVLGKLKTIVAYLEHANGLDYLKADGHRAEIKVGDSLLGIISLEREKDLHGRMRLRRIGEPHPAFEGKAE